MTASEVLTGIVTGRILLVTGRILLVTGRILLVTGRILLVTGDCNMLVSSGVSVPLV